MKTQRQQEIDAAHAKAFPPSAPVMPIIISDVLAGPLLQTLQDAELQTISRKFIWHPDEDWHPQTFWTIRQDVINFAKLQAQRKAQNEKPHPRH